MTQKPRDDFKTDNAAALPSGERLPASVVQDEFDHLADSAVFPEDLSPAALSGLLADLDTSVTGDDLDLLAAKVAGIEAGATADQTGAEIVASLNAELGGTGWQSGGGGGGGSLNNLVEDLTPQLGGNLDLNGFSVGAASAAALTKLSQTTATAVELNYSVGVSSPIQAQISSLNASKANTSHTHDATAITSGTLPSARIPQTVKNDVSDLTGMTGVTRHVVCTLAQFNARTPPADDATIIYEIVG